MELSTAIGLIEKGIEKTNVPQRWADLGAGSGLFTSAVAMLIKEGSIIYAIDKKPITLKNKINQVAIISTKKDFVSEEIGLTNLDGIIMANSLHFVRDKISLLERLKHLLNVSGRFIILEYDRIPANKWVPYPIGSEELQDVAKKSGFVSAEKLAETPSHYHHGVIYSAVLSS